MKLLSDNADQVEIDVTEVADCILTTAPSDSTNGGATYMFWFKQLGTTTGGILTTLDWSPAREGIRFSLVQQKKLQIAIFREGATLNRFEKTVSGLDAYYGTWVHITVVWMTEPRYVVYYNGVMKADLPGDYGSSSSVSPARLRMKIGSQYIQHGGSSASMVMDSLMVHDRPLSQSEIDQIV